MSTGTPVAIGFYPGSQSPIDERYLNEGVPYADEAEALSLIPLISRHQYLFVNIAGSLYWFKANLTEIEAVTVQSLAEAVNVSITDAADIYTATNVEAALQEVMGFFDALSLEFDTFKENNFVVNNYTIYNANTYSCEFATFDVPIIPVDESGNPKLKNAEIILMFRDTQPAKLTDYGFEPNTGLITLSTPLFENETLYIVYKKATTVQS